VAEAGASSRIPLTHEGRSNSAVVIEDFPPAPDDLPPLVRTKRASPGYFQAMGIPLVSGRLFQPADHQERTGAVLVNEAFARRFWPGQSALGKRLRLWRDEEESPDLEWYTIAGVVGSVRDDALHQEPEPAVYYPLLGHLLEAGEEDLWLPRTLSLAVRGRVPAETLAGPVRAEIWSLDADLPIAQVRTLEGIVADSTARTSFTMLLLLLAAAVALLLGSVGLYGVVSYVVAQRTREIGVRMALGARRADVSRMVVGQGLAMAGLGIVLGLVGAVAVTRLMTALLFQVGPRDLGTFAAAALLLLAVGLVASFLPAHRATRVDPNEALRYE
jgi:putative ABC transport system permease protein